MKGDDVKQVQMKLESLGFSPGEVDGEYGATTAAAVRAFQKANKLTADGIVGAETRKALRVAKTGAVVRQLAQVKTARTPAPTPGAKALA
jgi:peptidoglycan hydrolase-like protein with peptidoglycan-binding domain